MHSLNHLLQQIDESDRQLPPVEQWNPAYCGEMNLMITAQGEWVHEGSIIKRDTMRRLFSSILKREKNRYYLVTPVEKIGIKVAWQPFVIFDFNRLEEDQEKAYVFLDHCGNQVILKHPQQLIFSSFQGQMLPCIHVRRNLYASFSRSCYYRLIEAAEIINKKGVLIPTIYSAGQPFALGQAIVGTDKEDGHGRF